MTRWLVTGAAGLLGHDLVEALAGREVTAVDLPELDITDAEAVGRAVRGHEVVVNCAAFTAVDAAETREPEAFAVNALGPAHLADACARHEARLLQLSTDYVFAGDATAPYPVDAPPDPRNAYGRSKAAGEQAVRERLPDAHWIVRTAWLYGEHGPNFVRTMIRLDAEQETVRVVDDQRGQPTLSRDLAERLVAIVDAGVPTGTYHATNSGEATWYDLARRVFELIGADPGRVKPCRSNDFARPAARPTCSVLDDSGWLQVGMTPLRRWDVALAEAVGRLRPTSS